MLEQEAGQISLPYEWSIVTSGTEVTDAVVLVRQARYWGRGYPARVRERSSESDRAGTLACNLCAGSCSGGFSRSAHEQR